jgi:hypothetical protein
LKLTGASQPRAFYASVYLPATNEIAVIGGNTEKGFVGNVHIFMVGTEIWQRAEFAVIDARMADHWFF